MNRPHIHQHSVFTKLAAAKEFAAVAGEDLASDEALVIVPNADETRFIVSLRADGEHLMYV